MTRPKDHLIAAAVSEIARLGSVCGTHQSFRQQVSQIVVPLVDGLAQQLAYHEAQEGLLSKAWAEVTRLRAELAEVQRQLDAQMARLNENLTAANARIAELTADSERLDWLQFHGARVAWGNDDEVCNVVWCDRDGSYYTALFNNWRDAIDAAMKNRFKERP